MAIRCLACGKNTYVVETRPTGDRIKRRRICVDIECGKRITTIESVAATRSGIRTERGMILVKRAEIERLAKLLSKILDQLNE